MDRCGEDPLLIDLDKSASFTNGGKSPLIPAPDFSLVNLNNNPFDVIAGLTHNDPFEMACHEIKPANNGDLEVRFDLVSLNDSNDKTSCNEKEEPVSVCDSRYTCETLVSSNNVDTKNVTDEKCVGLTISNGHINPFCSPDIPQNFLQVRPAVTINSGNSFSGLSDELPINISKKSSPSMSVSYISPLHCVSESSNNESGTSCVFPTGKSSSEVGNPKDFIDVNPRNVNKTLNRSFAGFGGIKNQLHDLRPLSRSTTQSFNNETSLNDRSESRTESNFSSKSYGSMNQGFMKTSSSLNSSSLSNSKQGASSNQVETSTPHQNKKYSFHMASFQSPPVEILREAVRLSRSFSMGSTHYLNAIENNEDLFSIKPTWDTLDSSSDEENCSDDSLKSLRVNIGNSTVPTPAPKTPDSEALKKFKKRLSLIASAESSSEKQPVVKQRSRSADRTISDSALKSLATKTCPLNLPSALPPTKLEDVKLRPKNIEGEVKAKRGPLKAFVPLKNMLKSKEASKGPEQSASKTQTKPSPSKSPAVKKSSIKPAASSTPKRLRKPLAENNSQNTPNVKQSPKLRRSNSYELKNSTPMSKQASRSSSASRITSGIKPPTPVSNLPRPIHASPNKLGTESITTPKKKCVMSMLKVRRNFYAGKENINRFI